MAEIIFCVAVAVTGILLLRRKRRSDERAYSAFDYYLLMVSLYNELKDDPSMSSEKWRKLLPLFEDADHLFSITHPYIKDFGHIADAVREEIDELPCQKPGSSQK